MINSIAEQEVFVYNMCMSNILVTGAAGFVGSNLIPTLLSAGHTVTAVDREFYEAPHGVNNIHSNIIDSLFLTDRDIKDCDTVIHLANTARIEPSWNDPLGYYVNNIIATTEFFRRCQDLGVKKFIHFSSSSVYGNSPVRIQVEDDQLFPTNPYSVSKQAGEQSLQLYAKTTELIIVRPFTLYGETMDVTSPTALAIGKFIKAAKQGDPLVIHGTGLQRRDFLHVDDCVRAVLLLMSQGQVGVYNIGSGQAVSIRHIADCISNRQVYTANRPGPEYDTCANTSKLKELGWRATVSVTDWLNIHKEQSFKEFLC